MIIMAGSNLSIVRITFYRWFTAVYKDQQESGAVEGKQEG